MSKAQPKKCAGYTAFSRFGFTKQTAEEAAKAVADGVSKGAGKRRAGNQDALIRKVAAPKQAKKRPSGPNARVHRIEWNTVDRTSPQKVLRRTKESKGAVLLTIYTAVWNQLGFVPCDRPYVKQTRKTMYRSVFGALGSWRRKWG